MIDSKNIDNLVEKIVEAISNLGCEYRQNQGLILSESDLKCLIYKNIFDLLPQKLPTTDNNITGSPLHTEIPFYDEDDKLRLRPDITILDPRLLSIKHGIGVRIKNGKLTYDKLPSKGFQFGGNAIVIEIKFYKSKSGIQHRNLKTIKKDVKKIFRLRRRCNRHSVGNKIVGIIVIFNKGNKSHKSFHRFLRQYSRKVGLRVIYCKGNFAF